MSSTRTQKIGRVLKEELSRLIREEMNDPRLALWTITDVEVTGDLRHAHIHVSVYGTPEQQRDTIGALEHARGFLRGLLGKAIEIRYTPELHFHLDTSI